MKAFLCLLLLSCLFFSCEKDNENITSLQCEILVSEIESLIINERPDRTRIEASGLYTDGPGSPSFDGCIAEYSDTFYNMDQLTSYEMNGTKLILRFP